MNPRRQEPQGSATEKIKAPPFKITDWECQSRLPITSQPPSRHRPSSFDEKRDTQYTRINSPWW
ncbi:hypothetical protein HETIRDRAFT_437781 [Heterobasidion irregulare TC 32-1]|uniref:Uncharacterized protein n=1 Tax=Heterobasidion irregulare (strain TC 32-1) TaxID=747525 RepID=W4KQ50_HETIT|nr:uncharacterized protein HETIRDRAFT_437781 [Heterobasidion irregulare TC 32-1]ETW87186.1 hypothetical protein HETIRDRAFT_437781 [Heterobasidion irregulare TC 32-1]